MFEISPDAAITIYLLLTLGSILSLWTYQHFRKKRVVYSPEKKLLTCEYCNHPYIDDCFKQITRCPQCGSYNK